MKKIMFGFLSIIMCFSLVGCKDNNEKKNGVEKEEFKNDTLEGTYNKIKDYLKNDNISKENYNAFYYNENKDMIIVELHDNTKEKQEIFLKDAKVDARYIIFVQAYAEYMTSNLKCIETLLSGYITSELNNSVEKSLSDIIDVDIENIDYSKIMVTDNNLIYVLVKTDDENIKSVLDNYFDENYKGYKKANYDSGYDAYIYTSIDDYDPYGDLKYCKE